MIVAVALLVVVGCALASARRLWFAANPTALHPDVVLAALGRAPDVRALAALRRAVDAESAADWERELLAALAVEEGRVRTALVNEQLSELDHRIQRWARVPRVCASIATSTCFLLATLVLRRGLADAGDLTSDVAELVVRGLVGDALGVAALGLVGTSFCIAAQSHAKRIARARAEAADRLVELLERIVDRSAERAAVAESVGEGGEASVHARGGMSVDDEAERDQLVADAHAAPEPVAR